MANEKLPPWHSSFEKIAEVARDKSEALGAVKIGTEGALDVAALDNVRDNLRIMLASMPKHVRLLLVLEGFTHETRAPHEIPEVVKYMAELSYRIDPPSIKDRLSPETYLLLFRCGAANWLKPGGTLVRLNDAGLVRWRLCDVQ